MLLFGQNFRRIGLLLSGLLFLTAACWTVSAAADHPVTLSIPEICRFRVEALPEIQSNQAERIAEANLAVLSNSRRIWRLTATAQNPGRLEWSRDGQTWQPFREASTVLVRGAKSFWNNYHLYYRVRPAETNDAVIPQIEYQIYFED